MKKRVTSTAVTVFRPETWRISKLTDKNAHFVQKKNKKWNGGTKQEGHNKFFQAECLIRAVKVKRFTKHTGMKLHRSYSLTQKLEPESFHVPQK